MTTSENYEHDASRTQIAAGDDHEYEHSATNTAAKSPTALASLGLLIGRIVLGSVFVAHGLQKLDQGIGATQNLFAASDIPMADLAAIGQTALELVGGALLIIGGLTRVVGLLLAATMFAAAWFVHRTEFFVTDNGLEFVAVLGAFALLFTFVGPGRFSLDALLFKRRAV